MEVGWKQKELGRVGILELASLLGCSRIAGGLGRVGPALPGLPVTVRVAEHVCG